MNRSSPEAGPTSFRKGDLDVRHWHFPRGILSFSIALLLVGAAAACDSELAANDRRDLVALAGLSVLRPSLRPSFVIKDCRFFLHQLRKGGDVLGHCALPPGSPGAARIDLPPNLLPRYRRFTVHVDGDEVPRHGLDFDAEHAIIAVDDRRLRESSELTLSYVGSSAAQNAELSIAGVDVRAKVIFDPRASECPYSLLTTAGTELMPVQDLEETTSTRGEEVLVDFHFAGFGGDGGYEPSTCRRGLLVELGDVRPAPGPKPSARPSTR